MASGPFRTYLESGSPQQIKDLADAGDLMGALFQSTYTYDPDAQTVAALTPGTYELTVAGYSRQALAASAVSYDTVNDRAYVAVTDELYASLAAGETIGSLIMYDATTDTSDTTRVPLHNVELSTALPTSGGDVTIDFDAETVRAG